MNIRQYQTSDEEVVQGMMLALNAEDTEELPLDDTKLQAFFARLLTDQDLKLFLAEESEQIIGYATLSFSFSTEFGGRYAEIEELYLIPKYRNRGLGKELISRIEQIAKADEAKSVFLVASSKNQKAQKLYENLGYQQLPRIEYLKVLQ